jgi:cell division protease FtsH
MIEALRRSAYYWLVARIGRRPFSARPRTRSLSWLVWSVVLGGTLAVGLSFILREPPPREVPLSDFMTLVTAPASERRVSAVEVSGREYNFQITDPTAAGAIEKGMTIGPEHDDIVSDVLRHDVRVSYSAPRTVTYATLVLFAFASLLLGILAASMVWLRSRAKPATPSSRRPRLLNDGIDAVSFADLGGLEEAISAMTAVIAFLRDPRRFQRLGAACPTAMLLEGPPGSGKTLLARALAKEAGVPFFAVSGSELLEVGSDVAISRICDLFEQGRRHAPAVLFIDHLEAVGHELTLEASDHRRQVVQELLHQMDGVDPNEGVFVLGATATPETIEPALLRSGRLGRRVVCRYPNAQGRMAILGIHTRKIPLAIDVELETIAQLSEGLTGADLGDLVNDGALYAVAEERDAVCMADFEAALSRKVLTKRPSKDESFAVLGLAPPERKRAALYVAGQLLVARRLNLLKEEGLITLNLRIGALLRTRDLAVFTRSEIRDRITMALAGRAAEERSKTMGEATSLGERDLADATRLAQRYVRELGFGSSIPIRALASGELELAGVTADMGRRVEREVSDLIADGLRQAGALLEEDGEGLDMLSDAIDAGAPLVISRITALLTEGHLSRAALAPPKENVFADVLVKKEKKRPVSIFGPPRPAPSAADGRS